MLRLDFFESGVGETIIITFPDGVVGVVDAHPSTAGSRPDILALLKDKQIAFVCLTHPHKDHGSDLIPVLETLPVKEFWHTIDDVTFFIDNITQTPEFLAPHAKEAADLKKGWAKFVLKILYIVTVKKEIPDNPLRNDIEEFNIAGVGLTVGWPNRHVQRQYVQTYLDRLRKPQKNLPDHNGISAVLALKYAGHSVILGSDALKNAWRDVKHIFHKRDIPKASVLKVPHHGALNALHLHPDVNMVSYLELCKSGSHSILFAGDKDHPDKNVRTRLEEKTTLHSFFDIDSNPGGFDPLNLNLHGGVGVETVARSVRCSKMTVSIQANGDITCEETEWP